MKAHFRQSVRSALLLTGAFGLAATVSAQEDIEGSGDHPEIPRVAGSYIVHHDVTDYDRQAIPTGPYESGEVVSSEVLEGQVVKLSYAFRDPDTSTLRVKRNYIRTLEERGFDILYTASEEELSPGQGRLFLLQGTSLFQRGARECCHLSNRDRQVRYIAARSGDGNVLAGIAIYNARRVGTSVAMGIVTADEMDTSMEHIPLTADEMETGLIQDGRVAVQDILFEFDSDRILPESADALSTIASLMQAQNDMRLLVVGHTDNEGGFEYNLSLSLERAQAVVEWLENEHEISTDRLQSAGAGMMAPITTNRTEEGRAQNRRVELVELAP